MALRNFPVRKNPERNKPETRNNPEHIHKSRNPKILRGGKGLKLGEGERD
jgi:hypothetical protein